jgi:hypothetical protein
MPTERVECRTSQVKVASMFCHAAVPGALQRDGTNGRGGDPAKGVESPCTLEARTICAV